MKFNFYLQYMDVGSLVLSLFWVLIFVVTANKVYEAIRYRDHISPREWLQVAACLLLPVVFFVERFW